MSENAKSADWTAWVMAWLLFACLFAAGFGTGWFAKNPWPAKAGAAAVSDKPCCASAGGCCCQKADAAPMVCGCRKIGCGNCCKACGDLDVQCECPKCKCCDTCKEKATAAAAPKCAAGKDCSCAEAAVRRQCSVLKVVDAKSSLPAPKPATFASSQAELDALRKSLAALRKDIDGLCRAPVCQPPCAERLDAVEKALKFQTARVDYIDGWLRKNFGSRTRRCGGCPK